MMDVFQRVGGRIVPREGDASVTPPEVNRWEEVDLQDFREDV